MLTLRAMLPMTIAAMASTVVVLSPSAKSAEISDADHTACVDAKDYAGCVSARNGNDQNVNINIDRTNRPGIVREIGNDCGKRFAYIGAGQCQQVICTMAVNRNHPALAGKSHSCKRVRVGLFGRPSLEWGNTIIRAVNNPRCPQSEPALGYSSSCEKTMAGVSAGLPQNAPLNSEPVESLKNTPGDRGDLAVKACAIGLAQRVGGEGVLSAAARIARCEEIVGDTAQVVR